MVYSTIGITVLLGAIWWFLAKGIYILAEMKATKNLERRLFPNGKKQRDSVLSTMSKITNSRHPATAMIDYFLKIKGLQVINMSDPVDFWTRKYLMTPTKIRLNYFEQVKFYETFLNYPEVIGKVIHNNDRKKNYKEQDSAHPPIFKDSALNKKFA